MGERWIDIERGERGSQRERKREREIERDIERESERGEIEKQI